MATELQNFRDFLDTQLNNGHGELSPEQCLSLWRAENPTEAELAESVAAMQLPD